MSGERIARYDTPWRRLPWTGPIAVAAWLLAFWALSVFIMQRPSMPEQRLAVDARLIELPEPPPPKAETIERPTPTPVQRPKQIAKPRAAPAPSPAAEPSAAEPAQDTSQPPQSSASSATGTGPALAMAQAPGGTGTARHPRTHVREKPVGVMGRPLPVNIQNEDNPFDDGTGAGVNPGGWTQEYEEGCLRVEGEAGPCTTGRTFGQPGRPWCYDADPFQTWDIGTCLIQQSKATGAYKRGDYASALAGYTKLAEKDYAPAQYTLGAMYEEGVGVAKNEAQAAFWYRKAATAGEVKAEYNLAMMYSDGRGVDKDDKQAAHWYMKAALHGYDSAQYNIGVMYALGIGLAKDDKEAAYWYRKAAFRGNAAAQYNLGVLHEKGIGIEQNVKEAAYWYCKSAGRGNPEARHSLGILYADGGEVPQYTELAYFCWFFTVQKRGSQFGYDGREQFTKKLTSEQQARAEETFKRYKY